MRLDEENLDEHVFELACGPRQNNLGIVARGENVTLSVGGRDVEIAQSVALLNTRTTGAVVWNTAPRFAEWALDPRSRVHAAIAGRTVLELGSGTGVLARLLAPATQAFYATDQAVLLRLLARNTEGIKNVHAFAYDWEEHDFALELAPGESLGCVLACDTVYNDYLIQPFVGALTAVLAKFPDIPVYVALQVRETDLLADALRAFVEAFDTEFIEDVSPALREGFAVYELHKRGTGGN